MTRLPFQAIRCGLDNVRPPGDEEEREWSLEAGDFLFDAAADEEGAPRALLAVVTDRKFTSGPNPFRSLTFVTQKKPRFCLFPDGGGIAYEVSLSTKRGSFLSAALIDAGIAAPVDPGKVLRDFDVGGLEVEGGSVTDEDNVNDERDSNEEELEEKERTCDQKPEQKTEESKSPPALESPSEERQPESKLARMPLPPDMPALSLVEGIPPVGRGQEAEFRPPLAAKWSQSRDNLTLTVK